MSSWKWERSSWHENNRWDSESAAPVAYLGPFPLPAEYGYLTPQERDSIRAEFNVSASVRGGRSHAHGEKCLSLSGPGHNLEKARQMAMGLLQRSAQPTSEHNSGSADLTQAKASARSQQRQIADLQTQVLRLQTDMQTLQQGTSSQQASQAQASAVAADWAWKQTSMLCTQLNHTLIQQQAILQEQTTELNQLKTWIAQRERELSSKKRQLSPVEVEPQGQDSDEDSSYSSEPGSKQGAEEEDKREAKSPSIARTEIADPENDLAAGQAFFFFFGKCIAFFLVFGTVCGAGAGGAYSFARRGEGGKCRQ